MGACGQARVSGPCPGWRWETVIQRLLRDQTGRCVRLNLREASTQPCITCLQLCDPSMEEQLLNIHACALRLPWGATGIVSLVHGQGVQLRLSQEFLLSSQCDVQGSASARTGKGVGELRVGRLGLEP